MHKVPVFLIETESILRRYYSHSLKYVRFAIPLCLHEVLRHCLALFLSCDPADVDVKIFFSVSTRLQLWVYKVQFSFYMARETREIVVQVKNDPCGKPTFKKFNIEEFPVIVVDGTTQRLV